MKLPRPIENFFEQMGRFFDMVGRVFAWTPRPPYDVPELLRQMVKVGINSIPVVLLTTMFTGMVMALQTFTT
ncbi:MAG TPA: ABC transporter permease, partial [Thermoanaerobaculia bacterium]|nr:ABC transporter permease [Thermoanaerobaculia bacterium]